MARRLVCCFLGDSIGVDLQPSRTPFGPHCSIAKLFMAPYTHRLSLSLAAKSTVPADEACSTLDGCDCMVGLCDDGFCCAVGEVQCNNSNDCYSSIYDSGVFIRIATFGIWPRRNSIQQSTMRYAWSQYVHDWRGPSTVEPPQDIRSTFVQQ